MRASESRCPFCGAACAAAEPRAASATRAAPRVAAALGASIVLAGCGSASGLPVDDAGAKDGATEAAAHDAAADADGASPILVQDSGEPPPGFDAGGLYGDGGPSPIYGSPARPDGGRWGRL